MTKSTALYKDLFNRSRAIHLLTSVEHLLGWDQETYMPEGAAEIRGEQIGTIIALAHRERTSKEYSEALSKLIELKSGTVLVKDLPSKEQAALREWWRDWRRDNTLPEAFVKEFAVITSQAQVLWRQAKEAKDFRLFAPMLKKIVELNRKKAQYLGWKEHPYDPLLDLYEHDISTKEVGELFDAIKQPVKKLLASIVKKKEVDNTFLHGSFSVNKQLAFGNEILEDMGFNFHNGRVDISSHPFSSTPHPTDSRITTRIHKTSLLSHLLVILHEGGHSLYDMGLPVEEFGSPLCEPISLGMHECQSRFWETRIGQSRPFWKHYLPRLKKVFPKQLDKVTLPKFYAAVNKVEPTFIRVDADEVTYPLHVILRFEIERDLIAGKLEVEQIPEVWNAKMTELLGITPKDDSEGCLQDIHWSMGAFGYFPTYALGTLYASHLFTAFSRDNPDWEARIEKGDLLFIREWLRDKVHQHGRRYSSLELLKQITGSPLTAKPYLDYLNEKYA